MHLFYVVESCSTSKLADSLRMRKDFSSLWNEEVTVLWVLSITLFPGVSQGTGTEWHQKAKWSYPIWDWTVGEDSAGGWAGDVSANPQPQLRGAVLCAGSPALCCGALLRAHPAGCGAGKGLIAAPLQQPGLLLICLSLFCWNIKKVMLCLDYRFCRNRISRQCHSFPSWIASFERRK